MIELCRLYPFISMVKHLDNVAQHFRVFLFFVHELFNAVLFCLLPGCLFQLFIYLYAFFFLA